jgi:high affinity sulfate transporter 1
MKLKPLIDFKHPKEDILSGLIVALVSIPISMGYAQIAGLPAVYGLYGSLLPILLFSLVTSSPQFVVGVDAMPAVMVGGMLSTLGIATGSQEALELVPVFSLLVGLWFIVFRLIRAGRVVNYISTPVMGGFISGIGATIILMQVPKLFGGSAGIGELPALLENIWQQLPEFHPLSAVLGFGTVAIILAFKKLAPKFPMPIVMMVLGVILTAVFHLDSYGVKLLPAVDSGLPKLVVPNLGLLAGHGKDYGLLSLMIALVVMAQSLLATNSYALKYNDKIDNSRELIGYSVMNLASAAVGCCPINGSVSRTGMADQFGCKSQLMSITAAVTMLLVLLFGTPFLKYLPVPVLTGIVTVALIGIIDFKMAKRLWKAERQEFMVFMCAFFGVLLFGTIAGVVIGILLSFFSVIVRAVVPPKGFMGIIPGHEDFYNIERNTNAHPIKGTVIYRFNGNLFFANINAFQQDIESAIKADTKVIVVDCRGIGNIDITAAERLVILHRNLKAQGIQFYLAEHVGSVNDQLRKYGAGELIESGAVRRTIALALRNAGIGQPYPLEGEVEGSRFSFVEADEHIAEFEWLFGSDSEHKLQELAQELAMRLIAEGNVSEQALEQAEAEIAWGRVAEYDEDELLEHLELHLEDLAQHGSIDAKQLPLLEKRIEERRIIIEERLQKLSPAARSMLKNHRAELAKHFMQNNPEAFAQLLEHRQTILKQLSKRYPELEKRLNDLK